MIIITTNKKISSVMLHWELWYVIVAQKPIKPKVSLKTSFYQERVLFPFLEQDTRATMKVEDNGCLVVCSVCLHAPFKHHGGADIWVQ